MTKQMKQFLVCGKECFDIETAPSKKWLSDNYRNNGFKFSVIFSFEQIEKILNDQYYYMCLKGYEYEYAKQVKGNIKIVDGKLSY